MPHSVVIPEILGNPCWEEGRPEDILQSIALVDTAYASTFLAYHSPIMATTSREGTKKEAEVFDWLFRRTAAETLLVVTGEPGSGKSHFINWLRLRLDDALTRGEKENIKCVMIKRRSGSLRDALEQLVNQLPEFSKYLDKIKAAIENLTSDYAKRELCFKLSQLLHESPIQQRRLKELHGLFQDQESQKWLCREGGTIDRNIQRLISQSKIDEREALPIFVADDLLIKNSIAFNKAGESVRTLVDVLESDSSLCDTALSYINELLRVALEMLTGLGNQTLHQIFRSIRSDLKLQGQNLALFIEDVSTLSALDVEVVNVLEPQNDPNLCRLYGVLGMTDQAFERLPENMLGRVSERVKIKGGSDDGPLQTDSDYVDRFVARYLNALRLDYLSINKIAESRRLGRDVTLTACDECYLKEKCFRSFGKVEIEEQEIGLFPFRPGAAFRLLQGLKEEGVIRKNPRGLLQQILAPVVVAISAGIEQGSVNMGMPIEPKPPRDLGVAGGQYLGGWDEKSKQRLSYLLYYWTGYENLSQGASNLDLFREPLHLPSFSQTPSSPPPESDKNKTNVPSPQPVQAPTESPKYERDLRFLEKWSSNKERLQQDATFRDLLLRIIQNSVPWDEMREPFEPARKRATAVSIAAIEIEDMTAKPAVGSALKFDFSRSEENTALMRSSLRFRYLGNNSWSYPDSVYDRRTVGKWVRSNAGRIIQKADPNDLDPKETHKVAILFLIVAYQLSQKKPLPIEYSDVVKELFSFKPSSPPVLSLKLQKIAQDLPLRVEQVREFLISELNVPQGTGGTNFIDPLPIIRTVSSHDGTLPYFAIDPRYGESHWGARFRNIVVLGNTSWAQLSEALADELKLLKDMYRQIKTSLDEWQTEQETLQDQVQCFVEGCKAVKAALSKTNEPIGDEEAKTILARQENLVSNWRSVLGNCEDILGSADLVAVLQFKTEGLVDINTSISTLIRWVNHLEQIVTDKYSTETGGMNLDDEIKNAHDALDLFDQLIRDNKEDTDV